MASKETLNTLNKPFSRADIFYPGSMVSLNQRHVGAADHRPSISGALSPPRMSVIAISRLSLAPSLTGAGSSWWVNCTSVAFIMTFRQSNMKTVLVSMVDVQLLKSPSFLLLAFGGFLTMCGFFVPFIYLGRQAILVGIPPTQATTLVSVLGVVNIVARICCGCVD